LGDTYYYVHLFIHTCGILIPKWAIRAADATRCFF
jgi:hypothetical protein